MQLKIVLMIWITIKYYLILMLSRPIIIVHFYKYNLIN